MKETTISIIAAMSRNHVIGKDSKLPWYIPEDLKRFKTLTSGHVVLMGRKTYDSIGRPLPNRINVVITRNKDFSPTNILVSHSLDDALAIAKQKEENGEIFIIGGGQIYEQAMSVTDKLYLTIVDEEVEGDTFFPDYSEFNKVISEQDIESNGKKIKFIDLQKLDLQKN